MEPAIQIRSSLVQTLVKLPSTYGSSQLLCARDGLCISIVTLRAGLSLPWHTHQWDQLCVVLEGQYEEETEAGTKVLSPGSVLRRRAGSEHANRVGACPARVLLADITPGRARTLCAGAGPAAYFSSWVFDEIYRELEYELHHADPSSGTAIEALVCLLAARSIRQHESSATHPEWFARALGIVRAHYTENITVAQLAAAVEVHPVTLGTAFRRHLGKPAHAYITTLRVARARRELLNTGQSFAEVAQASGFCDESHMARIFRRHLGISPSALRRISGVLH